MCFSAMTEKENHVRTKNRTGVTELTEDIELPDNMLSDSEAPEVAEEASDTDTEEAKKSEETERSEDTENTEELTAPEELSPQKKNGKSTKKNRQPRKPVSTKRLAVSLLIKAGVILLVIWVTFTFILGMTINQDNNMHPAINDGDLIVSLRVQRPYLNAAVLYHHEGKTRAGRVVGLPGNVIDISESGRLLIDGSVAAEEIFYTTQKADGSDIRFPYTVEDGKAFILNDYREDTNDSRSFGAVDVKDIDGPILFILRRRGF